jgi:outer membrane receptor for ferrienterochelin and colicins
MELSNTASPAQLLNKSAAIFVVACLLASRPGAVFAAEDAFQFFREESRVVTASRRPQPAREAPMSIEVITAEDIRASGAVNIWDLLRFRAGINVQDNTNPQSDGLAVVSIRGFSRIINKDLQVMIDGRSYYSPSRSVASFEQLPV